MNHGNEGISKQMFDKEMIARIFQCIDHLFQIVEPKKLLYIVVDGVAVPDAVFFNSNCITPGTEFMYRQSVWLKHYVKIKMSTDKSWEGEHKIMSYICASIDLQFKCYTLYLWTRC
jgi:5'-3' exoribonuclease 1